MLVGIILGYSLMLYGFVSMLLYFSGPFRIIERFRDFMGGLHPQVAELFNCPFCMSTWIGGMVSALNYFVIPVAFTPFNVLLGASGMWWAIIAFDTFFGCGVVWLLHVLDDYLSSNTKEEYEDE